MIRTSFHIAFLDGTTAWPAPEGPGWYMWATDFVQPETGGMQAVLPLIRLSPEDALRMAKVIDKMAQGKPLNEIPNTTKSNFASLEAAVESGNQSAQALLAQEIAEAERAIKNLAILKQRAKEFGAND